MPKGSVRLDCTVEGCERPNYGHGLCQMHYQRWRAHGEAGCPQPIGDEERFWAKVDRSGGPDVCWPWTGLVTKGGYARIHVEGGHSYAHRYSYRLAGNALADDETIDHRCHTDDPTCFDGDDCLHRRCMNPQHMEPVTTGENTLRGRSPSMLRRNATHCPQGHPYDEANTYVSVLPSGRIKRRCRICRKASSVRSALRKAAGTAAYD